jgi:hypothetical protein
MTANYTKRPYIIPNDQKVFQMIKKYTFSIPRASKLYPNWNIWYENNPSGNPVTVYALKIAPCM